MHIKDIIKALFPIIRIPLRIIATVIDWFDNTSYMDAKALEQLESLHKDAHGSCIVPTIDNKQKYDLDIIVPCYNVESYIVKCIDSIISQKTKYDYRLILIDDGSKDKTGSLIDAYAGDPRVIIVHKENEGSAAARNKGLQLLNAKYVMFVDSDDMLAENAIDTLLELAYREHKAIINGNFVCIDAFDKLVRNNPNKLKEGVVNPKIEVPGFVWGKIFASELFQEICFPKGYGFEDTLFRQILCRITEECYITEKIVYKYRYHPGSISHKVNADERSIDSLFVYLQLHKDSKALGLSFELSDYEYLLEHIKYTAFRNKHLPIKAQKLIFTAWRYFLQEEMNFHTEKPVYKELEQCLLSGSFWSYWVISIFYL